MQTDLKRKVTEGSQIIAIKPEGRSAAISLEHMTYEESKALLDQYLRRKAPVKITFRVLPTSENMPSDRRKSGKSGVRSETISRSKRTSKRDDVSNRKSKRVPHGRSKKASKRIINSSS